MSYFEVDVLIKGKTLQVKGEAGDEQANLVEYLKTCSQQTILPKLACIASLIGYQNQELFLNLSVTLVVLASESFNLFMVSNSLPYSLSIISSIIYASLFSGIITYSRQVILQCIFCAGTLSLMVVSLNIKSFVSVEVAIGLLGATLLVLIGKILKIVIVGLNGEQFVGEPSLESNMVALVWICWKVYQIVLDELSFQQFDFNELYSIMMALTIISTLKIISLMEIDLIYIIALLTVNSHHHHYKKDVDKVKSINSTDKIKDKPRRSIQTIVDQHKFSEAPLDEIIEQTSIRQILSGKQNNQIYLIGLVLLLFLSQVAMVVYFFITNNGLNNKSQTPIFGLFIGFAQAFTQLIICDVERWLMQQSKNGGYYLGKLMFDGLLITGPALLMLFASQFDGAFSMIAISICPFLTLKVYHSLHQICQQRLDAKNYLSYFICFWLPLLLSSFFKVINLVIVQYVFLSLTLAYAFFFVMLWCKKQYLVVIFSELKKAISVKSQKVKLMNKLRLVSFEYDELVQSNIYIHCSIMITIFYLFNNSFESYIIEYSYFLVYLSMFYFYYCCLKSSYYEEKGGATSYSPCIVSIIVLLGLIAYTVVSNVGLLNEAHQNWSIILLVMATLFSVVAEVEKLLVLEIKNYRKFIRVLVVCVFFVMISHPFLAVFISFYIESGFNEEDLFIYVISGFFYIWLILTIIGIVVHSVLNLTQKSKKELFIIQYMSNQLKRYCILQDEEKILSIANIYESINFKEQDLLLILKQEKDLMLITHLSKDIEYDYSFIEADSAEAHAVNRVQINVKPQAKPIDFAKAMQTQSSPIENSELPITASFFINANKNKAQLQLEKDLNANLVDLKRLSFRFKTISPHEKQNNFLLFQNSSEFTAFKDENKLPEIMNKLFHFLSEPSPNISKETFSCFLDILMSQGLTKSVKDKIFMKFSEGSQLTQLKFRNFLADFTMSKYDLIEKDIKEIVTCFIFNELVGMIACGQQKFKYFLLRKNLVLDRNKKQIWKKDKISQESMEGYNKFVVKQQRKKANLLVQNHQLDIDDLQENKDNIIEGIIKEQQPTIVWKLKRKDLANDKKDKKFEKPQNLYSKVVNSFAQCYICYDKESDNFQIKSIKCSVSNLVALFGKVIDFVFVYGYSSIFLLIAYYNQDYSSSIPILSYIDYKILLILASVAVTAYVLLLLFHKKDFQSGNLGLNIHRRALGFTDIKFYTVTILFLLGSAIANYVITIALNSFICDANTDTLFNFRSVSCFSKYQYLYMVSSLIILIVYWPLSTITFPFSSAMNRGLEIKYKSEYEILSLQCKFLINGYNTLLNPFDFQTQQLISSILKMIVCAALAVSFYKMQPCSFQVMNLIEGKIYIILTLISFAGVLCHFVGFKISIIVVSSLLGLYLVYFIYFLVRKHAESNDNQNSANQMLQETIHKQKIQKLLIRTSVPVEEIDKVEAFESTKKKDLKAKIMSSTINI